MSIELKNIPNENSTCQDWILFHKRLRKEFFNNKLADEIFVKYFDNVGNQTCVYDDDFKKYFDRKGMSLGTTGNKAASDITSTLSSMFTSGLSVVKWALFAIIIGYAIYLLLPVISKSLPKLAEAGVKTKKALKQ
jgi:hypothetical protein